MKPAKAIVEQAIRQAKGRLSRAAALLGCSRQTLYTWIYQYDLAEMAGIRQDEIDRRTRLDTLDTPSRDGVPDIQTDGVAVQFSERRRPILPDVSTAIASDLIIQISAKVRESVWKAARKLSIDRGCTTSALVEEGLERLLAEKETKEKKE
jgi:regulatory Fis family protein